MKKIKGILSQDVTHHTILTLAAFGLVVASTITALGVATIGVQAQVAFAQNETVAQTAAAFLGDNRPSASALGTVPSTTRPTMDMHMGSTTGMMPPAALYCPKIVRTIVRGNNDATTTGDVSELQRFIASRYNLSASSTISGYFGSTTEAYLHKFQQEQGISPTSSAGPLTRAAIAKLCGGQGEQKKGPDGTMGSSTRPMGDKDTHPAMGSTTPPRIENHEHPVPPKPTTTPPVSYTGSSNAASIIEAVSEIGDGYTKLFQATLSSIGL